MNLDELEALARAAIAKRDKGLWWRDEHRALEDACTPERIIALIRVAREAERLHETLSETRGSGAYASAYVGLSHALRDIEAL